MKPTIKQLEALYWAGKLGSFQKAAAQLNTSDSAIAKRIAELRDIFQVRLIDPAYRHAKLTDHGQRLFAAAEDVLRANERLMERMGYPHGFTGVLRLGVSELVAVTWLPRLIQQVKLQHPQAVIELEVGAGGIILDQLKEGNIDLALIPGPMWGEQFECEELTEVEFQWMASPRLGCPKRVLTTAEFSSYPMLVHSRHGIGTQIFSQWLRRNGISNQRVFTANSMTVMIQLTVGGLGVSSLPTDYVRPFIEDGKLVRVRTSPRLPRVKYFAVYRSRAEYPFLETLIPLAKSLCDFSLTGEAFH
ncbi:HTH-type transcriptional regulator GltR [compost metagenome]